MTDNKICTQNAPDHHASFRWLRSQQIESLNIEVSEYQHKVTGALHYHLAANSDENVFLVALRTIPTDSTGVAHILEHTALCGSEKYPVRDPFFMMLRRSLNTFMNAFTSSDWTAYPFASQNNKDWYNLLDVYLDAVFFSRLDPLDFAQEGHRFEFEEPENEQSDLVYKGVVYNEMKGAMSSPVSVLWQTLTTHLYPTTTYHFNSGGEPENIPDLDHSQLKEFYQTHYHPSNAVFMTYGQMPVEDIQGRIHEQALSRFKQLGRSISVADETRYTQPVRVEEAYAAEDEDNKTHHVMGWLLGPSIDLKSQLEAHLLANVLLGDSSSPLRQALETSALGSAPSPICGLEDSNREMCFVCGLEGSNPQHAKAFEKMVFQVLEKIAVQGVSIECVESVLHQLELGQREVSGDGMPYGLQIMLAGLSAAIHRGDPIGVLNIDPVLEDLRTAILDPDYIPGLVRRLLLDNPHRVNLSLLPDSGLSQRKEQLERERLAQVKAQLSPKQVQAIIQQSTALSKRQNAVDDPEMLPKVGIEDVPLKMRIPEPSRLYVGESEPSITCFSQGTNGLVYQDLIFELPEIESELLDLLPYYSSSLTELGCAGRDYLETQAWQTAVCGSIHASTSLRGDADDEQKSKGYFSLYAKALARNAEKLTQLAGGTLLQPRFDELERIKDLISQSRLRAEQSITGRGHLYAMKAATSGMSPVASSAHRLGGLQGIQSLKTLDDRLQSKQTAAQGSAELAESFGRIHRQLTAGSHRVLLICEDREQQDNIRYIQDCWAKGTQQENGLVQEDFMPFKGAAVRTQIKQIWTTSTQVNFCAKAYPTVPVNHPDAVALTVLGEFIKNGFLHGAIREQGGAYGSAASQDSGIAAFCFASYRDPRLQGTLDDFDRAVSWLVREKHPPRQLEEAILGIIGSIDKPGSPAGEARQAFYSQLHGRSVAQREEFRARVLKVTLDDLVHVGETYLQPEKASIAIVTGPDRLDQISCSEDFELFQV